LSLAETAAGGFSVESGIVLVHTMNLRAVLALFKVTFSEWYGDNAPRLGAALAYYTVFSLSPLLIIVIAFAGLVFEREAAQGEIVTQLQGLIGEESAKAVQAMIENAYKPSSGVIATLISILTLLIGATGVFAELHDALNTIWEVKPKSGLGLMGLIRDRFLSFAMVLGIGFLLLVSLAISAGLAALGKLMGGMVPTPIYVGQILNLFGAFVVIMLLFAMIYRILPDIEIAWSDVWIGAAFTSVLFTIGKFLIGFYLGRSSVASAYGAASSLAIILIWVYYSAQIFLFGAEFTQVYAKKYGSQSMGSQHGLPGGQESTEAY
jgi:membrane protein